MPLNNQLITMVENLNKYELEQLESKVEELLGKSLSHEQIIKLIEESKFNRGEVCPRCKSAWIIKNGKIKGRQKYKCKSCNKQFDEFTNSPLSGTNLPLKTWNKFCKLMFQGLSLSECREELNLTIKTLFYMRHRILDIVNLIIKDKELEGVVEADQTYFRVSYKGNHSKSSTFTMPREPRKRGGESNLRGLSIEQVAVETAMDRNNTMLVGKVSLGNVSANKLKIFYNGKIDKDAIFCTDIHKSYAKMAKDFNLNHKQINGKYYVNGIWHIQHINAFHNNLEIFMSKFRGVSTKYLDNYMSWMKLREISKKEKLIDKANDLLIKVASLDCNLTLNIIKNRNMELI